MELNVFDNKYEGIILHVSSRKLMGKNVRVPHEWTSLELLIRQVLENNELADCLAMYCLQYYPWYQWYHFRVDDYVESVLLEADINKFQIEKKYMFGFNDINPDLLSNALRFGDIVTDFLIRYCGCTLIKPQEENIIITAHNDCHRRFENLLSSGYAIQKRCKVGYIKKEEIFDDASAYPEVKGCFYKLACYPTKDRGYEIDEIIELPTGEYAPVLQLRKKY